MKSFRNNAHRAVFLEVSRNMNRSNYAVLAALYLLTADSRLWNQVKDYVQHNQILFDQMKPKNHSTNSYAMFSVAKDLYLGTNHMYGTDPAQDICYHLQFHGNLQAWPGRN